MRLQDAVVKVNETQPHQILQRLPRHFPALTEMRVAVLGLASSPGRTISGSLTPPSSGLALLKTLW
jgi:UDP-glucose 6-dehydrogenase